MCSAFKEYMFHFYSFGLLFKGIFVKLRVDTPLLKQQFLETTLRKI